MKTLVIAAMALGLAACSTTSPDVVKRGDAQRLSTVQDAVVLNVRPVTVEGSQSGIGGTAGAVAGGVAGASVGGRREAVVVGVLGAVAGAVIGNAVERVGTREQAYEIMVQLRNGERRAIVQAQGSESFAPGDPVVLVSTGATTRVSRAQSVPPATPPQPQPAAGG